MKLLSGILSFLGVAAYGQDKSSNYMDEDVQRQEVVKQAINMNGGRLILSGQYHGSVGITYDIECDKFCFHGS